MRGSRADGTNPRAKGTNPRALGTNKKRQRKVWKAAKRNGWKPEANPPKDRMLPRWLRFEILKRDGFQCRYCGARPADGAVLQIDHITPRAEGGTDEPTNLTTACRDCNTGKGARALMEAFL